jgi:hypothetical protein
MRPVVRTPARRIGGCTAKRDVALDEGRRRHAGLCAHGGYLVGCHEPLRELELVLYPTTRIGPHVYVAAPGLAMVVVYGDADGLAWLPVRSSEGYSRTRRIVRLVAPDLLHGQCASARLGYVRPTALDRGRCVTARVTVRVPARFTARGVYVRLVALARGRRQYVRAHVGYERHRRCGEQHRANKEQERKLAPQLQQPSPRLMRTLLTCWRSLLFIGQVLTVCFALASTGYRVGRAGSSARWPFFGEIRASRYAKSSMHNAHSCAPGWGQCLVVAFSEVPTDLSRFSVCSQI